MDPLRLAALLGLAALVPATVYFGRVTVPLALSAVSVLLIVGSLWAMFGEGEAGAAGAHAEP